MCSFLPFFLPKSADFSTKGKCLLIKGSSTKNLEDHQKCHFWYPPNRQKRAKIDFLGYQKWHFRWSASDETCWDHPGHQKITHIDNGPGPGRNYGETAILHILHILASFLQCKTAIFSNRLLCVILLSITLKNFGGLT